MRRELPYLKQELKDAIDLLVNARRLGNPDDPSTDPSEKPRCDLMIYEAIIKIDIVRTRLNNNFAMPLSQAK